MNNAIAVQLAEEILELYMSWLSHIQVNLLAAFGPVDRSDRKKGRRNWHLQLEIFPVPLTRN